MPRTLLVPLIRPEEDPERASESALPVAESLAKQLNADVLLLTALDLPAEATGDGGQRLLHAVDAFPDDTRLLQLKEQTLAMVADVEDWLEQVAGRFSSVATLVRYGDAGQNILDIAATLDDPVVIMASHARRGFERAVVGSVAFKVVSNAEFPVIVVPVAAAAAPEATTDLRRFLVPLDGSRMSESALDRGIGTASSDPLDIHLVQVVEPLTIRAGMTIEQHYALSREEGSEYLEAVATRLRQQGHQVEWSVRLGPPADEIAAVADEIDADMIVMATHGHSGFRRVVMGSVAERVLHTAQRPLLLVRPGEADK